MPNLLHGLNKHATRKLCCQVPELHRESEAAGLTSGDMGRADRRCDVLEHQITSADRSENSTIKYIAMKNHYIRNSTKLVTKPRWSVLLISGCNNDNNY